jgi:hypothetical protein
MKKRKPIKKQKKLIKKKRYLVIAGIVAAVVLASILSYTMLANHQPTIISLAADLERVLPSGTCQIVCYATDPDGDDDELSYNWSASGGEINGEGATVNWTAPDSLGSYNVTVTVTDGRGGEDTDQITITVRTSNPPTVTSLIADASWTTPLGSLQVTCTASDPDDDELSYEWTTSGGNISGTGAVVNWTAPEEVGIYSVTVVVIDGQGSSATKTLPIGVATEQPPIIATLLVTAEHCYLKTYSWGYKVGQGQTYNIESIVSDTSGGMSYEWAYTGGSISGEGSVITWTAPNTSVDVTVTVIVSDIAGNMMTNSIILNVVACSHCTFGC